MDRKGWKKAVVILAGMSVMAGSAAQAESPEDFWAYTQAVDEDGNLVYEFDEIEVTLPADWEGKYGIETEELDTGELCINFYHPATREAYEAATGYQSEGAILFTLNYSQNYDFQDWVNYTEIIGSGEEGVYFFSLMQGESGFPDDAASWEEWSELSAGLDWLKEHIVITNPGEGIADPDNMESGVGSEDGEYIVADSSKRYLEATDLAGMNADELQMAINEIYARHHRKFVTRSIQEYFDSKSWYSGTVEAAKFDETSLNQYEGKNIALMIQCMNSSSTSNTSAAGAGTVTSGTAMYATTTVNIRSKASTAGAIMGVVPQGYSVTATGSAVNGWIPVNYNGIKGYISQEYLKTGAAGVATAGASGGNTLETQNTSGMTNTSQANEYEALEAAGGSIVGTMLEKTIAGNGDANVTVQTDDGSVYSFVSGTWSSFILGDVGDRVQVDYLGALNESPQYKLITKKSTDEELASGIHSIEGTVTYEGNDSIGIQTADGSSYDISLIGCTSRGEPKNPGDYVVIEYMGSLDAPEVVSVTKY